MTQPQSQSQSQSYVHADETSSQVSRSAPDIAGFCTGYELRRHRTENRANEGSRACRADWEKYIGPIERWGSCNPWEGHFGAVVLPFCRPERLAVICYIFEYTDNIALDDTEYRTVRSILGTKQIQSKMLLELLAIDAPCAEVVITSWKEMIATTAKQDKTRGFDTLEEYVDYRIIDTGAPFVDMLMRFGMGILLSPEEQERITPVVKPCYAALGLANDYFSFDIEWEEFQREEDKTAMTNARRVREVTNGYEQEEGRDNLKLQEYLRAQGHQVPGNVAWSLRCPRYHPELCEKAARLLDATPIAKTSTQTQVSSSPQQSTSSPSPRKASARPSSTASTSGSSSPTTASTRLDDIEDSSPLRRGRPATHTVFGVGQTINSANYLLVDVMEQIRQLGDPHCLDIYLEEMRNLFVGQSFDLFWTRQGECPSEGEYLEMVRQKTGGLFRLLTRLMVQIAPVQRKDLDPLLSSLSNTLGEYFQIRDDYKNLTEEYTGQKGFCEDLDEGKYSFPLVHALTSQSKMETVQLCGILQESRTALARGEKLDVPMKETFLQHLRQAGSMAYTEEKMRELVEIITDTVVALESETGCSNWVVRLLIQRLRITIKMPSKKVLIILSDATSFPLKKPAGSDGSESKIVGQPTGFFLMELAKPLQKLLDAGHEITFASPKGQEPVPDPNSESLAAFAGNFYERRRENELLERMKRENGFSRPRTLASIGDDELATFAGVFIPGGHAPLSDLGDDRELGRILRFFHRENKPTAAICHGPYALLSTKQAGDGTFAYKGYRITSWSDAEEKVMETLLGGEVEKVESSLRNEGAEMVTGAGEKIGQTTLDRELLTGGNPMAAAQLGDRFVRMISV
ncbi:isoprenoid synthase domain-containing protein [Aspergillus pseudoustus]|uniref:Isoprenoid synthase domain-containing protein n=1 Tax=Aspergillus pseudoustus TaxID=1810923 RepID=A0ABR4KFS1_9EURO